MMGMGTAAEVSAATLSLIAALALAEVSRRLLRVPCEITRRSSFALWGAVAVALALFAPDLPPLDRALPFLWLTVLTYLSFRYELLASLEEDGPGLGSFLFPLAAAVLFLLVPLHIALGGIVAVAFGDTIAALVGRRTGTRKFRIAGHARTMEGTLALFSGASAAIALVLILVGDIEPHRAVAFALIAGTAAAWVETACPHGTDNFAVPVATAVTLSVLERFSQ